MNVTELARQLRVPVQELREKLPLMGFDVGKKAIKVDSRVAQKILADYKRLNRELEEAARDLGAGEWEAFRDVLLPYMKPGLIAGALLAFTLSLDDFVITFFTAGPKEARACSNRRSR